MKVTTTFRFSFIRRMTTKFSYSYRRITQRTITKIISSEYRVTGKLRLRIYIVNWTSWHKFGFNEHQPENSTTDYIFRPATNYVTCSRVARNASQNKITVLYISRVNDLCAISGASFWRRSPIKNMKTAFCKIAFVKFRYNRASSTTRLFLYIMKIPVDVDKILPMIKCRAAQFTRPHIKRLFVFRSTLTRAMNLYSDKTKWQTSSLFRTQQSVRGFDANISLHHRFMCVCVYKDSE